MTDIRDNHYRMLNSYHDSREYAEFRKLIGDGEATTEGKPSLLDRRWEIDEAVYDDFLNMLPPLRYGRDKFVFREFCFGDITTQYLRIGKQFFCEFHRDPIGNHI